MAAALEAGWCWLPGRQRGGRGRPGGLRLSGGSGARGPLRGAHCVEPGEPPWRGGEYEYLPGYLEC